jgi:hypothetical protein
MSPALPAAPVFPTPLDAYPPPSPDGLLATLAARAQQDPFMAVATVIFLAAVLHTFVATRFLSWAHRRQRGADAARAARGLPPRPDGPAELLHFLGEVEVVFGLWAVVLGLAIAAWHGWAAMIRYLGETITYTEPMFVVVIMALAATRPVVEAAERAVGRVARFGGGSPAAWWLTLLTVGPLLGSFITEPAAMTICAMLLGRQFYACQPSNRLKYATLGLLFVNVSVGGTLTHFAAPPVLMVARPWAWDTAFMASTFGWRAATAIALSNVVYFAWFRREFARLAPAPAAGVDRSADESSAGGALPVPAWVTLVHALFMAWTVATAHYPALFVGGFLFFLGFARVTAPYQDRLDLKPALLVGFFLGGLVIHGGAQGWWIQPVLGSLSERPLFFGAALLTAFNDNALITYLGTLVPDLTTPLKVALVGGAVAGGGLTVIANAPNPAGQALLGRYFPEGITPVGLLAGAVPATILAAVVFRMS